MAAHRLSLFGNPDIGPPQGQSVDAFALYVGGLYLKALKTYGPRTLISQHQHNRFEAEIDRLGLQGYAREALKVRRTINREAEGICRDLWADEPAPVKGGAFAAVLGFLANLSPRRGA
jgi:hypothetical protein